MVQQLAWSVTNLFIHKEVIPEEDGEIYAFGFECMLATAIQVIVLLTVGLLLKCIIPLAILTAGFTGIKRYIGGWHANSHFACILGFTVISVGMVFLCGAIPGWTSFFMLITSLSLILLLAPIQHESNPKTDNELVSGRKLALYATSVEIMIISVILISPYSHYAIFGACGLFMAAISLTVPNKGK